MRKRVAVLPVLVILATSLSLPALAAEEAQGGSAATQETPAVAAPEAQGGSAATGETPAVAAPSEGVPGGEYPEGLLHIVVKGDTLWDLSAKYLGSPWLWPELWERNRFLTNPHYIYPGIRVVVFPPPAREYRMEIREPEPGAGAAEEKAGEPAPEGAPQMVSEPVMAVEQVAAVPELDVVRAGLFLPQRPEGIGNIRAGVDTRVAFSDQDKVFLSLTKEIPAGQLLGVYRVHGPVDPPSGGSVSGYVRYLVGILQVVDPEEGMTTAVVRKSFEDLTRADQIDEEIPGYAPIVLKPGGEKLEAVVLAGRGENTEFATGQVVYLDKGSDAGVEVGNLFRVFDGNQAGWWESWFGGKSVPLEVARAVVVRTLPRTSSAYILTATRSFPAGSAARRGTGPGGESTGGR